MKIAVIKLGAKGDVVRTLSILPALHEKYKNASITWITKDNSRDLLQGNPHIHAIATLPYHGKEMFDILYNFDIDKEATSLAMQITAKKKYGFYAEGEYPSAFNLGAESYLSTLFDDDVKKSNRKTYQELMFEAAELKYTKQKPHIYLTEQEKKFGLDFVKKNSLKRKIVGIHMGASPRWPSKAWHESHIMDFITKASQQYDIILFGGPDEVKSHAHLLERLKKEGITIHQNNPRNSDREFASLVNICSSMVCSDSFALHVSLALGKKTVGLFFCTSPYEIEDYGLLHTVVSPLFEKFFPERMNEYNEELVKSISADEVLKIVKKSL
ncbi:glycosyltransferase family 9 protein [Candidatus Pacearchaeota archaeon]|nr:glycosyltransferase family 9 protein [Candidatus Pacearchaeota archaeon]